MKKFFILSFLFIAIFTMANAQQDSTLKEYVGKFNFPDGSIITDATVSFDNGILNMTSSVGNSVMEKLGVDSFAIPSFEGTVLYKRNNSKIIAGVVVDARGYHLEGIKDALYSSVFLAPSKKNQFFLKPDEAQISVR